jgi:hypothetical protein
MNWRHQLKQPPWRTIVPGCVLLLLVVGGYVLWTPGLTVRDGRHDRKQNAIWISHGWLGDDAWFLRNDKTNEFAAYRNQERIDALASRLRAHHITDVYPHLCPAEVEGSIPKVDATQTERFLDAFAEFRVIPWIGGPNGTSVRAFNEKWRAAYVASVQQLFSAHPRLAGVQLNVEPLTSGDANFLILLEQLRAALPAGKILSVAAYPPPTRWHPFEDLHWDEPYFREVAKRSDQVTIMMYDTALRVPKLYQRLMAEWTREVLAWSEGKQVLLGVPTYEDAGVGYHYSDVENMKHALAGIHRGLARQLPENYQGIALYCEWEMEDAEWHYLREHFLKL